jgi:hypothetical protein
LGFEEIIIRRLPMPRRIATNIAKLLELLGRPEV